jgi:hypothetical protein
VSLASAFRAVMTPAMREAAQERKRQRAELREWQQREREKQREKFKPVPDARMDALHERIDSLGLPDDTVAAFKSLSGNQQRALTADLGDDLREALPILLRIEPGARQMALRWARAKSDQFISRLKACVPLG